MTRGGLGLPQTAAPGVCAPRPLHASRPTPRPEMAGPAWHWSRPLQQRPQAAASVAEAAQTQQAGGAVDTSGALELGNIRATLVRLEDTIIFSLIERAQFALNAPVYQSDSIPVPGFTPDGRRLSPLEYLLRETEQLHGKIRRYTSPDEHPFFPADLPPLVLPPLSYRTVLAPYNKEINVNARVMDMYVRSLLPRITAPGDDSNYGSSAMYDVLALQALSKRVHYGKFVAEAKFLAQTAEYTALIRARDAAGIMDLLTNKAVEHQVLARVRRKAAALGAEYTATEDAASGNGGGGGGGGRLKIDPDRVAEMFEEWVMPLTKDVEVEYLLRRLEWQQ